MIAPRSRTEPALPTTRRGPRPRPSTTVGAIMLVSRRPGVGGPPATRSYSPSMLFRWMPVPGTITPEPEPVDDESDAALPSRVDRPRRASCRRPGRARRAAGALAPIRARPPRELVGDEQLPREPAAVEPAAKPSSRTRVCSRITSTSAAIASALSRPRRARAARAARGRRRSGCRPTTAADSR